MSVLWPAGTDTDADTDDNQPPSMPVLCPAGEPAYMPAMEEIGCSLGPHRSQPMADALRTMASNMISSAASQGGEMLRDNWVRSLLDCLPHNA